MNSLLKHRREPRSECRLESYVYVYVNMLAGKKEAVLALLRSLKDVIQSMNRR